ncbi:MAG: GNAT family N-acetyltransferase [Anaerolineales bacterium]|nr:GNAT family N-acetyltransferase [Anaerolineales bacterium]
MDHPILPLPRETERLVLRPPSPDYAEMIQDAIEETFDDLHPWMPWASHKQSLEETKNFLKVAENKFLEGEDFGVSVFLRKTGDFVLSTGLHPRNWSVPKFEIGYWCRTSMQGRGFTTEAVTTLADMAFREMAAYRVEIRCDARNIRSRRVAELAGFDFEAKLRSDDRANDGSMRDTVIYVLLGGNLEGKGKHSAA